MAFKFADYEYDRMEELEGAEKVSISQIVDKPGIITFYKEVGEDDSKRCFVRFKLDNGEDVFIYTGAKKIVTMLARIYESEGLIPALPVKIVAYPTKNGEGYKLTDA